MNPPPASIRYRAANSGMCWRTWPPEGLTILVATPYLDEAERCHRVAFMHLGELQQIGTPAELRSTLHMKRLELRTPDLSEVREDSFAGQRRPGNHFDVQRFGDRLDLLAHDPERAQHS